MYSLEMVKCLVSKWKLKTLRYKEPQSDEISSALNLKPAQQDLKTFLILKKYLICLISV